MPRKPKPRFNDPGTLVYDLLDDVCVTCPQCGNAAFVEVDPVEADPCDADSVPAAHSPWWAPRRMVCDACGAVRRWNVESGTFRLDDAVDPWFGLPLALRAPAAGHVVWAYNRAHLDLLESYVFAEIRLPGGRADGVTTLAQKLPEWMTAAGSRERVLRAIRQLKLRNPVARDAVAH